MGRNSIKASLAEARRRARHVAAPRNAARHSYRTPPCAVRQDRCHDGNRPDRICCAAIIHHRRMRFLEMGVVIIGEDLGLKAPSAGKRLEII